MNRWTSRAVCIATLMTFGLPQACAQPSAGKGKSSVGFYSSVGAVVPGEAFDVALQFQLERGWHIYWQNGGDAGLPPNVKWDLPDGFTAGELQFPVPKRYVDAAGLTSYIHDDDPVLIVQLASPATISEPKVTVAGHVKYLICQKICIWQEADLHVELPVLSRGGTAPVTNVELFDRARESQPRQESDHLKITPSLSTQDLSPGKRFDLLVTVDVASGYWIPPNEPVSSKLINCDLFVGRTADIYFEKAIYPKPVKHVDSTSGSMNAYIGRTIIRVPGEVEAEEAFTELPRIGGVLKFQACDEQGNCREPEAVAFSLVAGGKNGPDKPATTVITPGATGAMTTPTGDGEIGGFLGRFGIVGLLIACFLYGLFINATPCVLPLLSIKVLGFVQQAHESRRRTLVLGLAFGVGVILFFIVLGFLASRGKNVLQYPAVVIGLGAVVMTLALSMLGVYTLQAPAVATKLEASIQKEGVASSFGKGALAPVLGFACTGPLLAGAFGWATQQPAHIALLAFVFAGLGMASPYMLLGANPNWLSFLPKPGPWMITFERIMGFLLLGMVVWLLHPLVPQIGAGGLEWTLVFLVAIAMACWILGKVNMTQPVSLRWRYRGGAAVLVFGAGAIIYGWIYPLGKAMEVQVSIRSSHYAGHDDWSTGIPWQAWTGEAVEQAVREGNTVFVDFTAAWCTICKANKALATNTPEVRDKMKALGVVPFQGDFTLRDPLIAEALRKHSRAGPPLNLIYPPGQPDNPLVLRTNLTREYLLEKLDQAGPSRKDSVAKIGS